LRGKKLTFSLVGHDGVDKISDGTHERFIINAVRFNEKMALKRKAACSTCGRE